MIKKLWCVSDGRKTVYAEGILQVQALAYAYTRGIKKPNYCKVVDVCKQ